jgi:hypothetical protein
MTTKEMLSEYEDQLRIVGMIVGQKLKHIRFACLVLLAQLFCFLVAGTLLTAMYVTTESQPNHPIVHGDLTRTDGSTLDAGHAA